MDYLEAYHLALELVKKAGFTLATVSGKSEACYYSHPARAPLLLRIATHSNKHSIMGLRASVVSKVTFSAKVSHAFSEQHVRNQLSMAIGRYFLDDPKPSEYRGKRGTWEHEVHRR